MTTRRSDHHIVRARQFLWLAVGLGLLAFGTYLLVTLDGSADFGWYAYRPVEDDRALQGDVTVLTRTQLFGAACSAAWLAVVAGELGHRAGRKAGEG